MSVTVAGTQVQGRVFALQVAENVTKVNANANTASGITAATSVEAAAAAAVTARIKSVPRRTAVVDAIQKVQSSVVSISSEKKSQSVSRWPFSPEENSRPRVSGMGTGVILDARGFILTNHHVVDKVQGIQVQLWDGSVFPAQVVQFDRSHDLALLKITPAKPLTAVDVGNSSDLLVGEDVITIGNAFGYENTVSIGIVSALGRNVTLSDDQVYRNLIQTDACINPGNSGGPLINIRGELVGINVAVRAGAQGIGFALPIDDVKNVAADMLSTRRISSTWHGLVAEERVENESHKVVLTEVKAGSPAETQGFKVGDELVRVNDLSVRSPLDVERSLIDVRPGQKVVAVVMRGGKEESLALAVEALPRPTQDPNLVVWQTLGIRTVPVGVDAVSRVSNRLHGGLFVQSVQPDSPAARAGIAQGDILVGMNVGSKHWETIRADNILYILQQHQSATRFPLQYYLIRQNILQQGAFDLTAAPSAVSRR